MAEIAIDSSSIQSYVQGIMGPRVLITVLPFRGYEASGTGTFPVM
jgi:hypothetical protein